MQKQHQIIKDVYAAKSDLQKADSLIQSYLPFIRSETAKSIGKPCTGQEDEFSIAMMAFHEAVLGYEKDRGAFLSYAALLIRSRIIDYRRKEARHQGHLSLYVENGDDGQTLLDEVADAKDHFEESANLEATKQEIEELAAILAKYGLSFADVTENSPKQERTLKACTAAVAYAAENRELLDELLRTGKLPLAKLAEGSGTERKTLERHRNYLFAMLLLQTNGYVIIREHLRYVLKKKGGMSI